MVYIFGKDDKPPLEDLIIQHYGVKGMRWGVRKNDSVSEKIPLTAEQKKTRAKNIAIGVGILTVAAGAGYAAYSLKKNGKINTSLLQKGSKQIQTGKKAVDKVIETPTEIALGTRGHSKGYRFLKSGLMQDPYNAFEAAGLMSSSNNELGLNQIRKLPTGEVAAHLIDPKGRKDTAGRTLSHLIMVPTSMSDGLDTIGDIAAKIWPKLEAEYSAFYNDDAELRRKMGR